MATKDQLIDEVASLKAKIAEMEAGVTAGQLLDTLGMALQAGHIYHYSEAGLNDEGELSLGSVYTYTPDGFEPYSGGPVSDDKAEQFEVIDQPPSLADTWLAESGLRLALPEGEADASGVGYCLFDTNGTPMYVTYTPGEATPVEADAAADRVKIAALESDVQALKIANAELRADNAKLRDPSLHGRVDQLKAPY